MNYVWHFEVVWRNFYQYFYPGILMTFKLTLSSFSLGLLLGIAVAFGRLSRRKLIYGPASAYVEFVRNTPFLVQLYFVYFGFSSFEIDLAFLGFSPYRISFSPFQSAVIALTFNSGGYIAEVVRAGVQAVSHGVIEAARSSGMSPLQVARFIILPQALTIVYPPLVNQLIMTMLGSSVASLVTVPELSFQGELLNHTTFRTLEIYIGLGVMYLILNWSVALLFSGIRKVCFRRYFPEVH
jgi:His/Glu/Gln/Arg/opine family amino acid ABC transporter permease subunit